MANKKYTGGMPKPRPAGYNYGASKRSDVHQPFASSERTGRYYGGKPKPRPAYNGVTGRYSTD